MPDPADQRLAAQLPPADDWRTTDQDEITRRRLRAHQEAPLVTNRYEAHPIFSNFDVHSPSGLTYQVEIRDLVRRQYHCECVDFRVNELGTCKHVEAVLDALERLEPLALAAARTQGSPRVDLVCDSAAQTLRVERGLERLPRTLRRLFDAEGRLTAGYSPELALETWRAAKLPELRISQEIEPWLECRRRMAEGLTLRRTYEHNVQAGIWPAQETLLPLFPYQREGMLHLACAERALLADELGLGKTVQAVAAATLLRRLERAERVLVVTAGSLLAEWEEQIRRFTRLPFRVLNGSRAERSAGYDRNRACFFTLTTYDAMLTDWLEVNERLRPEVVILDEAQRIKNWNTKTALAVKRLQSRYAWVLTGTPLENRIDELYSLVSFLDPTIFGPLFRFNREFYEFDERGRPSGYRNLDQLRRRIRPVLLRRSKSDVETELPNLVERTFLVPMSDTQWAAYRVHEAIVSRLVVASRRRPLAQAQRERLLREMGILRMICDSLYVFDTQNRACPKLEELARILSECMANPEVKVLIFSEWERMLELVSDLCRRLRIEFGTHTDGMTASERRQEIQRFRDDAGCRVLLSTDVGGVGLKLPNASVVINCDQPWNPARLAQRIARAWRQDHSRAVTVLNLVSEHTIEQRMLGLLARKPAPGSGSVGAEGESRNAPASSSADFVLQQLEALFPAIHGELLSRPTRRVRASDPLPVAADRIRLFAERAAATLNGALVSCEERFPAQGDASVLLVVVAGDLERWKARLAELAAECLDGGADAQPPPEVRLEIIDRAASDLLRRLAETGVIHPSLRASRVLYPAPERDKALALSPLEQNRARRARDQHARKLKMARLLAGEEMIEESRAALGAAIHELGRALAIEHRHPEPANARGALAPPVDSCWPGGEPALRTLRTFLTDEHAPLQPVISLLGLPVESGTQVAKEFFAGMKAKVAAVPS